MTFFFDGNYILEFVTIDQGGQLVGDQEPHFLLCRSKEPHHSREHTWTSPHLFHTQTHAFAQPDLL